MAKRKYSSLSENPHYQRVIKRMKRYKRARPPQRTMVQRRRLNYVGSESNYVDLAAASYNYDSTGSIVLLNTVAQGASVNQRIGKKFRMTSLQYRGRSINNSAATATDNALLIVYDKRPTGALPAITDILVSVSSKAMNNDVNSGRFKILKREDFVMVGDQGASNLLESSSRTSDFYMKLNHLVVNKAAGTGAIGDIEEGALYLVTVGAVAAGTTAATETGGFRLRFRDI